MNVFFKQSHLIFFALLLLTGCSRSSPVAIKPNEFFCEHCKMSIVDMSFKAEILSPKGKVFYFDSIECMLNWARANPKMVGSRWVSDFFHPEKWIPLEKAFLLKSENIASPMGGNLSAYSSSEERAQAQRVSGGEWIPSESF